MKFTLAMCAVLASAAPALADIRVDFREGAPKDTFYVTNTSKCVLENAVVTVDLSNSAGKLIFDTTGSGAGVEVFQPFEVVSGADALSNLPDLRDGDTSLALTVVSLAPGAQIVVTTDLDDTIGAREITVSGSEFAGVTLTLAQADQTTIGTFDDGTSVALSMGDCTPEA